MQDRAQDSVLDLRVNQWLLGYCSDTVVKLLKSSSPYWTGWYNVRYLTLKNKKPVCFFLVQLSQSSGSYKHIPKHSTLLKASFRINELEQTPLLCSTSIPPNHELKKESRDAHLGTPVHLSPFRTVKGWVFSFLFFFFLSPKTMHQDQRLTLAKPVGQELAVRSWQAKFNLQPGMVVNTNSSTEQAEA